MPLLPKEKLDEIRNSVDIVDVVSKYIPLTQKGRNFMCACPFHNDNNPSMSVSKEKQIYTCFSCHKTGNVFSFVRDYENISFMEAVKIVADIGGINVSIKTGDNYRTKTSPLFEVYELSHKFYQNNLYSKNGKKALEYLTNRKLDNDTIKEFGIGLSLKERDLLSKLLCKKYDDSVLNKSGLVLKNDRGYVDMFYNRIMFPLWDLNGNVVGYSGRIYDMEDTSKYINTMQTDIFKKGELLYNYHRAKNECRRINTVIIMEGFMDLLRAYTVGVKNVIATMGTAVTTNQANLIKKMAHNVVICFDGDAAGERATYACANELINIGCDPKIVRLKENLDPDEYILKYGGDSFKEVLDNTTSVIDFKIAYLKKDRDMTSSSDLALYVNDIIKELSKIDDDILVMLALKKVSAETNLEVDFLKSKLTKPKIEQIQKVEKVKYSIHEKAELGIIYYMLKSNEVIRIYGKQITYMPTLRYRLLAREIYEFYKTNGNVNVAELFDSMNEDQMLIDTLSEVISQNDLMDEYTLLQIDEYIEVIRKHNIRMEKERIKNELKDAKDSITKAMYGEKICEIMKVRE